jgi:polyphosphate glucokinase
LRILGIDIGGSGIKGAPVDVERGCLAGERFRLQTPQPATPAAMGSVVRRVTQHFDWDGPVGCTFPALIRAGVACTAANIDAAWIGTDVEAFLGRRTGTPVTVLNDADAAGLAEVRFGAARGVRGVVLVLTIGTGIGSALFLDGRLVPNTEFGHLELEGIKAEWHASDRARKEDNLGWKKWARRLNGYLRHVELLLSPDLIVLGGGVCRKQERFLHRLETRARVVPAQLGNQAGIIGVACAAHDRVPRSVPRLVRSA